MAHKFDVGDEVQFINPIYGGDIEVLTVYGISSGCMGNIVYVCVDSNKRFYQAMSWQLKLYTNQQKQETIEALTIKVNELQKKLDEVIESKKNESSKVEFSGGKIWRDYVTDRFYFIGRTVYNHKQLYFIDMNTGDIVVDGAFNKIIKNRLTYFGMAKDLLQVPEKSKCRGASFL